MGYNHQKSNIGLHDISGNNYQVKGTLDLHILSGSLCVFCDSLFIHIDLVKLFLHPLGFFHSIEIFKDFLWIISQQKWKIHHEIENLFVQNRGGFIFKKTSRSSGSNIFLVLIHFSFYLIYQATVRLLKKNNNAL